MADRSAQQVGLPNPIPGPPVPHPAPDAGASLTDEIAHMRSLLQDSLSAVVSGFTALVDSAPLTTVTLDHGLRFTRVNPRIETELGFRDTDFLSRSPDQMIANDAPVAEFLAGLGTLLSGHIQLHAGIPVRSPSTGAVVTIDILRRVAMAESHGAFIYAVFWDAGQPWKRERGDAIMETLRYFDILAAAQERFLRISNDAPAPADPDHPSIPLTTEVAALLADSGSRLAAGVEALVKVQDERTADALAHHPDLQAALRRIDDTLRSLVDTTDRNATSV